MTNGQPRPRVTLRERMRALTIRERIAASFWGVMVVFSLNVGIYRWMISNRNYRVLDLGKASRRQSLLATIDKQHTSIQKRISLLSGQIGTEAPTAIPRDEQNRLEGELAKIGSEIEDVVKLADTHDLKNELEPLRRDFIKLRDLWKDFYRYLGVDHGKALELAINAEPISKRIVEGIDSSLERERSRINEASAVLIRDTELARVLTIAAFLITVTVAIAITISLSRYLNSNLQTLEEGTAIVGAGNLDHRIHLPTRDELGHLANAFNTMTEHLQTARAEIEEQRDRAERERARAEHLLLNILPEEVAEVLKSRFEDHSTMASDEVAWSRSYEDITILFTDFVHFTSTTQELRLQADDLAHRLHRYFTVFDDIIDQYGLEKVKMIGDSYMCVGGLPEETRSHPVDVVMAAFEMMRAVVRERAGFDGLWAMRIGIHTGGPVFAGVIAKRKFAMDIWSSAVNFASRMESSGVADRINLSEATYHRVKDFFQCESRGKVLTKEGTESNMYFVKGLLPELIDSSGSVPPVRFKERYEVSFQRELPSHRFPAFLVGAAGSSQNGGNSDNGIESEPQRAQEPA